MEIEGAPPAGVTDKGHDWRAEIGTRDNAGLSVDLGRAREPGRGREATTPEQIPLRGWRDILWRVFWSISEDRILSTSGGVAFFALLAVFPGIAAIVSLYGLFAGPLAPVVAGEAVGLIHDIPPAATIVERIMAEAGDIWRNRHNSVEFGSA